MDTITDTWNLERFVTAQDATGAYARAVIELRAGRKASHWMWFVFPQIAGLGSSAMSRLYALASLDEAAAYLQHVVLGRRLRECATILAATRSLSAVDIFGEVDAHKLQSSMTLFGRSAAEDASSVFGSVLDRYFDGVEDPATLERI